MHGVYTTGSTGEFYAIDEGEFRAMVGIVSDRCGGKGMALQIGCCADATRKTLRLLDYAAGKPAVGAAQVCLPYWMELSDREVGRFFADLTAALRILPQRSFFVGENYLATAMELGACGCYCYSSLVFTNPRLVLDLFAHAETGRWAEALTLQRQLADFIDEAIAFVTARGEGDADPVFDKGLVVAAGSILGHQRCRAPYIGWSDETVAALRAWIRERHPEFLFPGT